jgi:AbiV family abortive infection protein
MLSDDFPLWNLIEISVSIQYLLWGAHKNLIMKKQSFLDLSPTECGKYYPVCIENGKNHFHVATLIAAMRQYGMAISHMVLGSEELLKGMVLLMDYKGFDIRKIQGINRIFWNHRARHAVLKEAFSVWLVVSSILQKGPSFRNFLISALGGISNYYWWRQADDMKNRGLYVDFQDILLDPASIRKEEYQNTLRHVMVFEREVDAFIISLNSINEFELKELLELFRQSELDELLHETITRKNEYNK